MPDIIAPTNWDEALVDAYADMGVVDVYGALRYDPVGGGRPAFLLPPVSRKQAERHIRAVRDRGMAFCYLVNAPCMGNMEHRSASRDRLLDHLRWIRDTGATAVTVSIPLLVDLVRTWVPELDIRVSAIAHVSTPRRARLFAALGATEISLDFQRNRDLDRLALIRQAVDLDLSLVVNDICLFRCPFRTYCYNGLGHSAQSGRAGFHVDYCSFHCNRIKMADPVEVLRSPWYRPQDLAEVQERTGITRFKVSGRTKPTAALLRSVGAYAAGEWHGDMMDILDTPARETDDRKYQVVRWLLDGHTSLLGAGVVAASTAQRVLPRNRRNAQLDLLGGLDGELAEALLRAGLGLADFARILHIDADSMEGMLAAVGARDCGDECGDCPVCEGWADRAVEVDEPRRAQLEADLERVITGIVEGHLRVP